MQSEPKIPNFRDPTGVREITIKMPVAMAQGPGGKVVTAITMQPEAIKIRPGGNDQNQIQCFNCQGWGHMGHKCFSTQNARPLNSKRGSNSRTSPQPLNRMPNMWQCWCQAPANRSCCQSPILKPGGCYRANQQGK